MKSIISIILLLMTLNASANSNIVMITLQDESESTLGKFPVKREVYANAINMLADKGAKSVILKFFIDQSNSIEDEEKLAKSLDRIPVILQAELNNNKTINRPKKIAREEFHKSSKLPNYSGGFFPLDILSEKAKSIGYANARLDDDFSQIDLFSTYNDAVVSSVVLNTIEEVLGKKATFDNGVLSIGNLKISLNEAGIANCNYLEAKNIPIFSFNELLTNKIPRETLNKKVVILGYMRKNAPEHKYGFFNLKSITSHELFSKQVSCLLSYE